MITVQFTNDIENITATEHLYQWDVGQVLNIKGLSVGTPKVHFAVKGDNTALVVQSELVNDDVNTLIPDKILQSGKNITAYIYLEAGVGKATIKTITIPVIARNKPNDYVETNTKEVTEVQSFLNVLSNDITELEKNKANKTDVNVLNSNIKSEIDVERKRIDTLTQLPSGSTSGDAELMDIRVGVDGKTYTTAGNAVRGQVSELKSNLSVVNEALTVVESFNKYNANTIISDTNFSGSTGKQVTSSGFYTTDYIECGGKEKVFLSFVNPSGVLSPNLTIPRIVFYSAKNENSILWFNPTQYVNSVDVPEGAMYCRLALANAFKDITVCISFDVTPNSVNEINTYFEPYFEKCLTSSNEVTNNYNNTQYGFITEGNYDEADYCYIPVYGQSFTLANDGEYKITDSFDENCYMIGDSPKGYEVVVDNPVINPLNTPDNFEYIQADMISLISKLSKKYAHIKQNFLISGVGEGGMTILKLSKNNGIQDRHFYENKFLVGLLNAKKAMNNANKTFSCPCILYMQGESDYSNDTTSCFISDNPKELYKERFIALKNNMQEDVMNATGQSYKPIIITYCVGGKAFNSKYEEISTAQLELAEENDDVICVGSYYQAPDFKYHLTPDGRRWLAEQIAKVWCETFIKGIDNTLKIGKVTATKNKIYIPVNNAVLPLKIDNYTVNAEKNNGFMVYDADENEVFISDVSINDNVIVLTTNNIMNGVIKVTYGNSVCHGNGNIRDCDKWLSYYTYESNAQGTSTEAITYIPKDENGNDLIGKKYPLWKWLPNFCIEILVN